SQDADCFRQYHHPLTMHKYTPLVYFCIVEFAAVPQTSVQYSLMPKVLEHQGILNMPKIAGTASTSALVPGSHPDLVLLTGIDDDELTHHPFVLVQEHMAVVHIRQVRVGVVLEAHEESVDAIRFEVDRVLAPAHRHRRGLTVDVEHLELHIVDMEAVGNRLRAADLPHLGVTDVDDLVDAAHIHPLAVDLPL